MTVTRTISQRLPMDALIRLRGLRGLVSWLLNRWIASWIARREREAALGALHKLDDRELKDIGIHRSQISDALSEIARERSRLQRCRPSR